MSIPHTFGDKSGSVLLGDLDYNFTILDTRLGVVESTAVTQTSLTTSLSSYATTAAVTASLSSYATTASLSSYATTDAVTASLASKLDSTSILDATKLTGDLPAISGANLTNIATAIPDSTITGAKLADATVSAAKLDTTYLTPTGDGSGLTGIAGGFSNYIVLSSGSSYTFPDGVTTAKVTLFGGGGGGGRGGTSSFTTGGAGGAGGSGVAFFTFPGGSTATYTVGSGGAGLPNSPYPANGTLNQYAASGGTSSITINGVTATATGGGGGRNSNTSADMYFTYKGADGSATGCDVVLYLSQFDVVISGTSKTFRQYPYYANWGALGTTVAASAEGTHNASNGIGYATGGGSGGNGDSLTAGQTGKGGDGAPGVFILEY